ncbi:hypothetical protein IJ384_04150 [bacterium]|nr:hypothetical protein [bacterium]
MADLNFQQKNIIKQLKQAYPELKSYSDEQILSLYNKQLNNIQLSEDERISIMNGRNGISNDGMGLRLEGTQTSVSKEQEAQLKSALIARLNAVSTNVKKAEDSNGFLGKAWGWTKNTFNFGDSSDKVREQQKADLKALESGNIAEAFKKITGLDYTVENVNKFLNNEVQTKSETALNGYTEGQDMASDITADIISSIAAVGIYTAAVAAAPFTGGASIVVGVAAAGASAAAIKTGIKYADAKSGGREYTADNLKKDLATGAFSGVLAPITGGLGGAVGKTVATKVGIQAVKQVGKEVTEEAVEQTAKGFVKTMLTNPTGYEYIGGNMFKRGLAFAAEAATDGAIGGAVDNAFRTAYDGGSLEDIGNSAVEGFVGGAIMSPVIGGGMKVAGKGAQKIFGKNNVHIDANQNMIRTDVIDDLLNKKIDLDYAAAVLRDVDDLENVLKLAESNLSPNHKVEFEHIKKQLIEKVNKNIADHGSIVLQTEISAERFTVDSKTGVRYAKTTRDDIVLAHAVQNDNAVESLTYLINATRKYDENNYLSLSLVNKNSNFFGDGCDDKLCQEYGIIPRVKNKDITSAGFGQVSEYKKDFNTFIRHSSLSESPSDYVYLKTCLLDKLKENGYDLSDSDYVQLFNLLKNKEYFGEITDDIEINGNIIKAETLKNILEETHVRLSSSVMFGNPTNNEVSAIIDGIKAIYARVDNIEDVKPEILALAKENSLDIVLLGKPTKLEISNPKYFEELSELESLLKNKEINPLEFKKRKRNLKNKYESIEKEKLRARTSLEQNSKLSNDILEELLLDNSQAQNLLKRYSGKFFSGTIDKKISINIQKDIVECTLVGFGGSKCAYKCKYKGNEYCILLPHKAWNNALNEHNNTLILKNLGLLVNDICEIIKIKINNEDFPAIITSLYDSHKYKIFDCKNKNYNLNDYYDLKNLNEDNIKYFFADILEDIKILIKNNIFLEQDSFNFAVKDNTMRLFFNDLPYAQLEKIKNNSNELKKTYISYVINNFFNVLSGDIILTNAFLKKIYENYDYLESIIDELSRNI